LIEHYQAEREGADRVENLQELVSAAESFVSVEGFGRDAVALPVDMDTGEAAETGETLSPLAAFLTHAALESGENQALAGAEAIQMMTVHAAKGLEFDAVFITGLEEGLFPHENALSDHLGLEEERRLMYVAITRARKRLYLSHSQTRMLHGQTRYNIRSRFFDELPEHTLKWLSVAAKGLNPASAWGSSRKHDAVAASTDWTTAISPASPASASGANAWVRAGVPVFHNKFGEGAVLAIEGSGEDARAQVKFGRHGVKWLALSVAKLTPV
jgi:DNA helicase-2/ATP-dependent DNA helicase PcrA